MKKTLLFSAITIATSMGAFGQNVNIPDANFKAYLVGNSAINTNSDTEIQVSEATAFTGSIVCQNMNISDLTGIEEFINITELNCHTNNISTLNISENSNLTSLNCGVNNITSIDVSGILGLSFFNVAVNNLNHIDISSNINLTTFACMNNNLISLNAKNISTSTLSTFFALSNPNLSCIEVDDVAAATSAWTNIDATASFSLDCNYLVSSISVQGQGGVTTINTQGGTLQMEASVIPMYAGDASYAWSVTNGTGSASIDVSGLLTAISNGTVTITATANDGSGISGDVVITISNQSNAGISDLSNTNNLSIYPNPSSSELTINYSSDIIIISATILDAMGRTFPVDLSANNTIDVSNLSNGVYLLHMETDKGLITKKFIKE